MLEGAYTVSVALTDLAGNTQTVDGEPIVLDTSIPTVSNVSATSNNSQSPGSIAGDDQNPILAADGDIITVSFDAADTGSSGVASVTANLGGYEMNAIANDGTTYEFNYTVNSDEFSDGDAYLQIIVTDAAGNQKEWWRNGWVTVDVTAPTAETSALPSQAAIGVTVIYQVVASENIANATLTATHSNGVDVLNLTTEIADGNLLIWRRTIRIRFGHWDG